MTIRDCKPGQSARVLSVGGEGALRQHFLDMGLIPGVAVTVMKLAPMGDPMELRIRGYELTLRLDDAAQIEVEPADPAGSVSRGCACGGHRVRRGRFDRRDRLRHRRSNGRGRRRRR